ncbi:patellin-4 [Senna tora]|uniref:Patellin-4 n=1 Tax=Senna tora TaxID=362788 RepID=A0A835CGM6_9FABA|nr:patellin-4 [Senna tora]
MIPTTECGEKEVAWWDLKYGITPEFAGLQTSITLGIPPPTAPNSFLRWIQLLTTMTAEVMTPEETHTTDVAIAAQEEPKKSQQEDVSKPENTAATVSKPETVEKSSSYKEESNFPSDLKDSERRALNDLKSKLEEAILENTLFPDEMSGNGAVSLWGVPLLPSKAAEGIDVILLKFLRARDFKPTEAFEMLKKTLRWRKESEMDSAVAEADLGSDLGGAAFMDGVDREGHPVCYNVFGVFGREEVYEKAFGTEEKRREFIRWRCQVMEKGIGKLSMKAGGVSSLLQVNDLKNSPGPAKKELRVATKQALAVLQDNYPEMVAKNIFINVPFWYIPMEEIPVNYGGFKRENESEFTDEEDGGVSEISLKSGSTATIEIPCEEVGNTVVWDLTVLGWEVNYKEEFVPSDEGSYTVIVQKEKKMGSHEGPVRNSFRNNEAGKVVLTVENSSSKKKRVLYPPLKLSVERLEILSLVRQGKKEVLETASSLRSFLNEQTMIRANAMSGRVIVAYCRELTTERYKCGSETGPLPVMVSLSPLTIGVLIDVATKKVCESDREDDPCVEFCASMMLVLTVGIDMVFGVLGDAGVMERDKEELLEDGGEEETGLEREHEQAALKREVWILCNDHCFHRCRGRRRAIELLSECCFNVALVVSVMTVDSNMSSFPADLALSSSSLPSGDVASSASSSVVLIITIVVATIVISSIGTSALATILGTVRAAGLVLVLILGNISWSNIH